MKDTILIFLTVIMFVFDLLIFKLLTSINGLIALIVALSIPAAFIIIMTEPKTESKNN